MNPPLFASRSREDFDAMLRDLLASYERPFRQLLLLGVAVFLLFGVRELLLYGEAGVGVLGWRGGVALLLFVIARWARRLRGEPMLWAGVAYMGVFAGGISLTAALSPNGWIMHALAGLTMIVVAFGPLWPRPRLFLAGTAAILLPPLLMLLAIGANAATWLDYGAYLVVAAVVAFVLFRVSQGMAWRGYQLRRELLSRATSDALTGVLNRAGWETRAAQLLDLAQHDATVMTLLFLDLDHFKQVNDRFGHATGDAVLEQAALAIRSTLRGQDLVARLGGEEFVVLLPGVDADQALQVAERIRRRIAEPNGEVTTTVSGGLARRRPGEPLEQLLHRADLAMMDAKRAGRNRVCLAE